MPTYRLILEYEGTRYRGWQEQKNARTVAGELRAAVEKGVGRIADLSGSGRTDAGVHALAQVAHLRLREAARPEDMKHSINDLLPPDIHVVAVELADERFHARHDAVSRSYLYQISRRRTALAKRFVWWVKRYLDPESMREAVLLLPGRHDFRLLCESPSEQPSTVVVVESAVVEVAGGLILVRLVASHFLWKMVRRIVGCLVRVGAGEMSIEDFGALLRGKALPSGNPAEWTAPPSGLFLERVLYAGDPPLPPVAPTIPVAEEPSSRVAPRRQPEGRPRARRAR